MRRVDAGGFFRPAGEESAGVGHEEMEQLMLGKKKTSSASYRIYDSIGLFDNTKLLMRAGTPARNDHREF